MKILLSAHYIVVQGGDPEVFCKTVQEHILSGFEPVGGVAVTTRGDAVGFFQSLVKRTWVE